jgi:23S rRNA (cytosine1962-C5)-methyltransferase
VSRRRDGVVARLGRRLERVLAQGHPWIWRDALEGLDATPGTVVTVVDRAGRFVARGIADRGPIGVRVFTLDERESVDEALFARRIAAAAALRDRVVPPDTNAYRLLHGEGDRVPGVVCDVYAAHAVVAFDGAGAEAWRDTVLETVGAAVAGRGVTTLLERRGRRESLVVEAVRGTAPTEPVEVREHGMMLLADLAHGQKTGLFLDHRESRRRVRALAAGLDVLNLYGYTGAFSIAAGLGAAAHVDTVDLAAPALALADAGWEKNGLDPAAHATHKADVPAWLRDAAARGASWDLVIADPPSFAPRESAVPAALAAYRKLHAACLAVLRPGGLYLGASCSSHVRRDAFEQTLVEAAARRPIQLLESWGAPADHPRLPAFPEGDYLKAVLARA